MIGALTMACRLAALGASTMAFVAVFAAQVHAGCMEDGSCVPPPGSVFAKAAAMNETPTKDRWGRPILVAEVASGEEGDGIANAQSAKVPYSDIPTSVEEPDELDQILKDKKRGGDSGVMGLVGQGATFVLGAVMVIW